MLTALNSLPEDVLLDAEGTPPESPTYGIAAEPEEEQRQQTSRQSPQKPLAKQQSKGDTRLRQSRCIVS